MTSHHDTDAGAPTERPRSTQGNATPLPLLAARCGVGGVLMGLANLVPGISGGTMLLAAGVYTQFIDAIARVTTLRFSLRSLCVLASIVVAALAAIVLLAGPVKNLVIEHRWAMYSLFIGLTLGGAPVIWRMVGRAGRHFWIGAAIGFVAMGALAWFQQSGAGESTVGQEGFLLYLVAGIAGASAMVLPGVSGGYLLLVLGVYVPILSAIDQFKEALKASDAGAASGPAVSVLLPVGIGVVVGVFAVSNVLRILLRRFEKATLGVLMGLLIGAVVGLWPYQEGVEPAIGDVFRGRAVTEQTLQEIRQKPEKYPTDYFVPAAGQILGGLGLILAGFVATTLIAKLGSDRTGAGSTET